LVSKFILQGKQATSQWRFWVLLVMVVLTLVFSCYLQPEIAEIKQLTPQGDDAVLERFDLFHEISRDLYLILTLLGLALVISTDKVEI
ncbi:MAG: DUF4149 domain-containing protein, partial [Methylophagaceae bacterium]